MDAFHINFNIFGKYSDFNSWLKAELVNKRKEKKAAKREKRNGTKFWMTETLIK